VPIVTRPPAVGTTMMAAPFAIVTASPAPRPSAEGVVVRVHRADRSRVGEVMPPIVEAEAVIDRIADEVAVRGSGRQRGRPECMSPP
jgi:hypothetical protein